MEGFMESGQGRKGSSELREGPVRGVPGKHIAPSKGEGCPISTTVFVALIGVS